MARRVISMVRPDIQRIAVTKQSWALQEMSSSVSSTGSPNSKNANSLDAEYVTDREASAKARYHQPQTFAAVAAS